MLNQKQVQILQQMGINSPPRTRRLIAEILDNIQLQLQDLVIFTEAASGHYVYTPIIAAVAGAKKVYAITADSPYAKASSVARLTLELVDYFGVSDVVEIIFDKSPQIIKQADLITNLGFVRPIDANFVAAMKDKAVIAFMREVWEQRSGEIDFEACRLRHIPIMGTNEEHPDYGIFDFVGPLCLKMLFQLEIEVYKSQLVVVSSDKFGPIIIDTLKVQGAEAHLVKDLNLADSQILLQGADAVIIADFVRNDVFIGQDGHISAQKLYALSPGISVLQFAGQIRVDELKNVGIPFYPESNVNPHQMTKTFAYLGPRPVIELHAAGLKVGEVMCRLRQKGLSVEQINKQAPALSPAQPFDNYI